MKIKKLDALFNPKYIAVIGATDNKEKVGYAIMNNILRSDYNGELFPVNKKRHSVHSIKAYSSIKDIPEKIDLAIIATPAKTVSDVVEEYQKTIAKLEEEAN